MPALVTVSPCGNTMNEDASAEQEGMEVEMNCDGGEVASLHASQDFCCFADCEFKSYCEYDLNKDI